MLYHSAENFVVPDDLSICNILHYATEKRCSVRRFINIPKINNNKINPKGTVQ